MHNSDPSDMYAERPRLGDRIPPRPPPVIPDRSPAEIDAVDQVLEEDDGSDAYFDSLVLRHQDYMAGAIRRAGVEAHDLVEDILQEVWIKVLQRRRKLAEIKNRKAWLARVAYNHAIDRLRRSRPREHVLHDGLPARPEVMASESIWTAVEALPSHQREVVRLKFVERRTAKKVADLLDVDQSTVNRRIKKIRESLADFLRDADEPFRFGR